MIQHIIDLYMLIILDNTLAEVDFSNNPQALLGLEGILRAYMRGCHYAVGEIKLLAALESSKAISPHYIPIIRKIRQSFSTNMDLAEKVGFYVRAVSDAQGFKRDIDNKCWHIPVSNFNKISNDPTILICEDLYDVDIYLFAGHHYALSKGIGSIRLSSIPIGGGGGSTSIQYKRAIDKATHFSLCITDSDFESPYDESGGITRQRCSKYSSETSWVTCHHAPKARELENVIPINLLKQVLTGPQIDSLTANMKLAQDANCDLLSYGDFKKGISLQVIVKYPKGHPSRAYWKKALQTAVSRGEVDTDCWEAKRCVPSKVCTCKVFHAVGEGVSKSVLTYLNGNSYQKTYEAAKKSANLEEWLSVGQLVVDWCCAPVPQFG